MRYKDYVHRFLYLALFVFSASPLLRAQLPQPLRIDSVQVTRSSVNTLDDVTVTARNMTSQPQSGVLWYVLATPGEPEPWRVYDYASPEQAIQIPAGAARVFEVPGPAPGLDGTYELSVWLHSLQPQTGERFHSDVHTYKESLVIAPAFSFAISHFTGAELGKEAPLLIRFSVRNNGTSSADIGLQYRISRIDEKVSALGNAFARTARVAAGVDYVVTVQHRESIPPGTWKLTGWLYELSETPRVRATREETLVVKD